MKRPMDTTWIDTEVLDEIFPNWDVVDDREAILVMIVNLYKQNQFQKEQIEILQQRALQK